MTQHHNKYQAFGLHPLVAFGVIAVDLMLFGGEASTLGVSWVVSIAVAVALAVPVLLLQRYAYKDDWGTAAGKAVLLAVLTAILTPIPALIPAVAGFIGMRNRPEALPEPRPVVIETTGISEPENSEPSTLETELSRVLGKHGLPST